MIGRVIRDATIPLCFRTKGAGKLPVFKVKMITSIFTAGMHLLLSQTLPALPHLIRARSHEGCAFLVPILQTVGRAGATLPSPLPRVTLSISETNPEEEVKIKTARLSLSSDLPGSSPSEEHKYYRQSSLLTNDA